ncbi:hypothetical protein GCM10027570_04190 [Streptomonospora sediminis]
MPPLTKARPAPDRMPPARALARASARAGDRVAGTGSEVAARWRLRAAGPVRLGNPLGAAGRRFGRAGWETLGN